MKHVRPTAVPGELSQIPIAELRAGLEEVIFGVWDLRIGFFGA